MSRFPKNVEIVSALQDHGVKLKFVKDWDSAGVPWKNTGGLEGVIAHHTGTKAANGPTGHPTLGYVANHFSRPAANMLVGRGPGEVFLVASGATYHCGEGGPAFYNKTMKKFIVPEGNEWKRIFGVELDGSPANGVRYLTDFQIKSMAQIAAAILDLTGHGLDRLMTHGCWTNGCHGVNPLRKNDTFGRKADTSEDTHPEWPGKRTPFRYNAPFWRSKAKSFLIPNYA